MKKKNFIITSIITIALCMSMIAGSTFALFTSESKVNIAVNSGKVSVVANIDKTSVQTKELYDTEYSQGADNMFEGEATFSDKGLTLERLVPGDGIKFNIVVKNESTVSVKYRTIISCENNNGLFEGLEVSIADSGLYNGKQVKSDWSMLAVGSENKIVPIVIELPEDAGNEYQGKNCTISYMVEAVQGNAYTGPDAVVDRFAESELPDYTDDLSIKLSGSMWGIDWPTMPDDTNVEAAWTFTATDTAETVEESPYKNWICDFMIECDQEVAIGELGLIGKYESWENGDWLSFSNPIALSSEQSLFMLTSTLTKLQDVAVTYEMVCKDVKAFDCGVFRGLAGDQMKGKTITVSLCLIDTDFALGLIEDFVANGMTKSQAIDEAMKLKYYNQNGESNFLIANKTTYTFQ